MSKLNPEFYAPYNYTPDVPRARHNLSGKRAFTVQTGALVPVLFHRVYKGDDFKLRPLSLLQTILPLERQLLDCFELRIETYLCPLTNYYGWMDNNSRESSEDIVEGSEKWRVQLVEGPSDNGEGLLNWVDYSTFIQTAKEREDYVDKFINNPYCVQKGSMFQHIGVPAGFAGTASNLANPDNFYDTPFNTVNIERILAYLDIVRCYHVNTQYEDIPFYSGMDVITSRPDGELFRFPFTHQQLDDLFVNLRYLSNHTSDNLMVDATKSNDPKLGPLYSYLTTCYKQQGGFFPVQHRPDFMRNLLSIVNDKIQAKATVVDGQVAVSDLQDKSHLESFYNALYLSGGRYSNRIRTSFGMKMHQNLHIPLLLNVQQQLIDPSNITASAESGDYKLGEMAAKVDKFNDGGVVRVRPDVDSYLVVLASITPLPGYSQGFEQDVTHLSFMDDFTPELQGMSFESVPRGIYSALPETSFKSGVSTAKLPNINVEVGKTVKWMHYRTDVNRVYGEFTPMFGEFDNMVLSRSYSNLGEYFTDDDFETFGVYFDIGPYVNPLEYNHVFAFNSLYQEPWSLHMSFNIQAKRPILKRIKPGF